MRAKKLPIPNKNGKSSGGKKPMPGNSGSSMANTAAQALKAASTPAQLLRMGFKIVPIPGKKTSKPEPFSFLQKPKSSRPDYKPYR
jgi:hypothetical protein